MKAWWKPRTLRFRLALWYSLGGTVLLAAFSATLYGFVAQRLAEAGLTGKDIVRVVEEALR